MKFIKDEKKITTFRDFDKKDSKNEFFDAVAIDLKCVLNRSQNWEVLKRYEFAPVKVYITEKKENKRMQALPEEQTFSIKEIQAALKYI